MFTRGPIVFFNASDRRPVFGLVRRQPAVNRIDPEREQFIKGFVVRCKTQWLAQQIKVESLEVSEIENQAVALRNRPVVERIGWKSKKQGVGSRTSFGQPGEKVRLLCGYGARGVHGLTSEGQDRINIPCTLQHGPAASFCSRRIGCAI